MAQETPSMKRIVIAFILLVIPVLALGQTPPPGGAGKAKPVSPFAEYAGDWVSTFEGKFWLILQLELHDDQLSGSLVHARNYAVDDSGELKSVSEEQVKEIVTGATVNPDGLLLTFKDPQKQEPDRFLMRITVPAKNAADLKMIAMVMPPGMSKPKPWKLAKTVLPPPPKPEVAPALADFAGEWISTFETKVWLLLQLELHGDQLTGWITHSTDLDLNEDGGLKSVSEEKVKEKIAEATLADEGLFLTVKSTDRKEPDQYLMRIVVPAKAADLSILATDMPAGMPKPQPWVLLKFEPSAINKQPAPH